MDSESEGLVQDALDAAMQVYPTEKETETRTRGAGVGWRATKGTLCLCNRDP